MFSNLGMVSQEKEKKMASLDKLFGNVAAAGIQITPDLKSQLEMGVERDIQAQRIPPNVKVPSRRNIPVYLKTMYGIRKSLPFAFKSLFSSGSWTSSGGSFKLAEDNGMLIDELLGKIAIENDQANLLEVGAGYAGLYGKESQEYTPRGIGKLMKKFGSQLGITVNAHFTNLTTWHESTSKGITEHWGHIASTIGQLEKEGIEKGSIDVIYSQCAAYFDQHPELFIEQSSRLLRRTSAGGYLIFNGKTEHNHLIVKTARKNGFDAVGLINLGGMNGTLYIFKL